jgi:ABC-type molybdate transport system ATPase subunit
VNVLDCSRYHVLGGVAEAECDGVKLIVPYDGYPIRKIAISSRDIFVSAEKIPGPPINLYRGEIVESWNQGSIVNVKVRIGGSLLLTSEIPEEVYRSRGLKIGDQVYVKIKLKTIRTAP